MFGSQPSLIDRRAASLGNRASADVTLLGNQASTNVSSLGSRTVPSVAYLNVSSTGSVTVAVGNPVTAKNPIATGNPVTVGNPVMVGISNPTGSSSAAMYYNIPVLVPRNSRGGSQSEQSAGNSQQPNMSNNPPIPHRNRPSSARACPSTNTTHYYIFPVPVPTTEVNHLPTGQNTACRTIPRSESLNNVGRSSSQPRKEKSASGGNSNNNRRGSGSGRLWRHYSVGDLISKLQAVVSGGLSLPRGLVRSMSRFSVAQPSNPASSPDKVSPDPPSSDHGFFSSGLKQRSASEILRASPPSADDAVPPCKSPSPEREAPPIPPPRLVVRPKPAARTKVHLNLSLFLILLLVNDPCI